MSTTDDKQERKEGLLEFYTSYSDLFNFFCSNTTIHGAIRLVCSENNRMKTAFWAILFPGTVAILYWQFGLLFGQYFSHPVSIGVSVNFNELQFPSVTVCTLNPYRYSAVREELKELDAVTEETLYKLYGYTFSKKVQQNSTSHTSATEKSRNSNPLFNKKFVLEVLNRETSVNFNTPEKKGNHGVAKNNPPLHNQNWQIGFKLCNASGQDCYFQAYSSGVDAIREWYKYHYINIMAQMSMNALADDDSNPDKADINNFVFACSFNGAVCSKGNYTTFHHPMYGNCYTFNSWEDGHEWSVSTPGVESGLSLLLRTEQNDFIPLLSTVAGARVMVHSQNHPVFMEDGGFDIKPGVETSIGLRQEVFQRLGGEYGDCLDGTDLDIENLYESSYTQQACIRSCFQLIMVKRCGCAYYFYPLPKGASYCNYNRHIAWGHCYYKLYNEFSLDNLGCSTKCRRPCQDTEYTMTAGYATWPTKASKNWIFNVLNKQNGYNITSDRNDIAKVNIYFEDLNYRTFGESPAFTAVMLLSNLGSQWSLWFGSSVMSVVELAELVFDLVAITLIFSAQKYFQWKNTESKVNTDGHQEPNAHNAVSNENHQEFDSLGVNFAFEAEDATHSIQSIPSDSPNVEMTTSFQFDVVADISPPPAYDSLNLECSSLSQTIKGCNAECQCSRRLCEINEKD
ncbi:amiloride-sensitive sodium channel subunit alpha-like isoform X1 [Erpetoichthys calabaricus]|uniref:amiloride-sensitive sodium channel subunit alpha-like isoform X1 n=1 Tax=Erpetoichthys calabaricus TaxID=27687 RepID=UPI0022346FB1|nr:amiloride-sensitive sodium channel subunit alpha-like isoform X1 [Erpetoichthys calabaricus]XP_051787960.1 amiloride-sensitive sodium channel subunit alpha-like isoform X1 [Erpetoichthys calabaricus]